jgi:diguanylate cyclase (GGDEF)-like protein/PAS domain S-box-containing protein
LQNYSFWLVALSILVAILASYTALSLATHLLKLSGNVLRYWLFAGSLSIGLGIWSMHFIGMLAFHAPVKLSYDIPITMISLAMAIISSYIALSFIHRGSRLLLGALAMGTGIALMHYTGMAAIRMVPSIRYDPLLFVCSVLIAITVSGCALWLASNQAVAAELMSPRVRKIGSAVGMGIAISGMHYTGMAATIFAPGAVCISDPLSIDSGELAVLIASGTISILVLTGMPLSSGMRWNSRQIQAELRLGSHLFDTATVGVMITDRNRVIISVNPAFAELSGYSREEAIGKPSKLLVSGIHNKHFYREMWDAINKTGHWRGELFDKRKTGEVVPTEASINAVKDSSGQVSNYLAIFTDISKRKEAETKRQETIQRFQLATDAAQLGVWDWDLRTDALHWDERMLELYGLGPDHAYRDWREGLHPEDVDRVKLELEKALSDSDRFETEFRVIRPDGTVRMIKADALIIRGEDGTPIRMTGLNKDITESKKTEEKVLHLAHYDVLTDLPNRTLFTDRLQQTIAKAKREKTHMALMFLDLDRFKEVNDSLGHDMGDVLLKEAAHRLVSCLRETDTVARLGGDEFTIILGELNDPDNVEHVAQNILQKLSEPFKLGEDTAYVSASIGITLYPEDAKTIDELLKNADQAMYLAKNTGRNRFSYFTPSMQEAAQMRMRIATDLHGALDDNQFRVYYQPIVELATGTIDKAEALIRWQHPQRGLVSPAEFIPIAEDTGMIVEIGNWVFQEAARQAKSWRKQYRTNFQVSVNKSPVQFRNEMVTHTSWYEFLKQLGLSGRSIVVEITEGLLMDAGSTVTDKLLEFRDAGMQVALDDFGTGYSSLSYLKKFHIDYLKIDQSFTRNLAFGSEDMALCEAIIVMAHKLGLKVIAEGVETEEQRDLLAGAGCDYGQGYLFSMPLPAREFAKLL